MNFLFWNTHKNTGINKYVADIVNEKKVDTIILCEYKAIPEELISLLPKKYLMAEDVGCGDIRVFSNHNDIVQGVQESHYSIHIIDHSFILCAMHLPSRRHHFGSNNRKIIAQRAVSELEIIEKELGCVNSIVVGDLNDNPYDETCLAAESLHGLSSIREAERKSRIIDGVKFNMFYNPMWSLLGDNKFPPGTYYYSSNDAMCSFWYMFDQVLIRPQLKELLSFDDIEIMCGTESYSLLDNKGHPDITISDHLPLFFRIGI